ncbi:hypothetical protein BDV35DRAFT_339423 [Aspergillus flavus]|uniref:Uncharacterized protein n=1 Tax=Aspergillus flavus TaxID=5059 RepID=A0A5N6HDB1_ASPFL|nr:hypothetical protein BDV35DRAFT_339423 [Aspergillus flavus]
MPANPGSLISEYNYRVCSKTCTGHGGNGIVRGLNAVGIMILICKSTIATIGLFIAGYIWGMLLLAEPPSILPQEVLHESLPNLNLLYLVGSEDLFVESHC